MFRAALATKMSSRPKSWTPNQCFHGLPVGNVAGDDQRAASIPPISVLTASAWPRRASSRAHPFPMPRAAPVINATFPSDGNSGCPGRPSREPCSRVVYHKDLLGILIAIVVLIVYGSLYPWAFEVRHLSDSPLYILFHSWDGNVRDRRFLFDVAVNIAIYVPLGATAYLASRRIRHTALTSYCQLLLARSYQRPWKCFNCSLRIANAAQWILSTIFWAQQSVFLLGSYSRKLWMLLLRARNSMSGTEARPHFCSVGWRFWSSPCFLPWRLLPSGQNVRRFFRHL